MLPGLPACEIEYNPSENKNTGEDTADDTDDPPVPPDGGVEDKVCWPLYRAETIVNYPDLLPNEGSDEGTFCAISTLTAEEGFYFDFNAHEITDFTIVGTTVSQPPMSKFIRVVGQNRNGWADRYPDYGNNYSGLLSMDSSPTVSDATWTATATTDDQVADMSGRACWPECDWERVTVEIYDEETATAGTCDTVYLPEMYFCPTFSEDAASRVSPGAHCAAGSGRFRLVPIAAINRNRDDRVSYRLQPVQISGSGILTSSAWVTRMQLIAPSEGTIATTTVGRGRPRFDEQDRIASDLPGRIDVDSAAVLMLEGTLGGGAPLLVEDFPLSAAPDFEVEMEWSCGRHDAREVTSRERSYSLSLADLDCLADWPQRLSLILGAEGTGPGMAVQLYGLPEGRFRVRTTPTGAGDSFVIERRGLRVEGMIVRGADQQPSVVLDGVSFAGAPLCRSGTYPLAADE